MKDNPSTTNKTHNSAPILLGLVLLMAALALAVMFPSPALGDDPGFALEFDGAGNYVILGDTGDIMGATWDSEKTVSVWIKPTSAAGPSVPFTDGELIFGNDVPRWFGITRATWDGGDRIWVWNGDGNGLDAISIDFIPGEWFQVTMVHTGGMLYAYKNGDLIGSTASGPTHIPNGTNDGNLYVGGSDGGTPPAFFQGQIDELRLWAVGLDQATIQAWIYSEVDNTHPNWANLAAYYKMSNGVGTNLSDDSANTNNGTLMGGMGDSNWVASGALTPPTATPTPTPTPTSTPPPSGGDYALEFDGVDDHVIFGDTGDIMGGDGWASDKTVSVWVKPTRADGPAVPPSEGELIAGNGSPHLFGITRATWNGSDRIWLWNLDKDGAIDILGVDFTPGEWVQITLRHTGGVLYAYRNGVSAGSVPSGTTQIPDGTGDGNLHIGGSSSANPAAFFQGQIDEARFWNIALNETTIADWTNLLVTDAHPNWANLAAYYQMTDGNGASVTDNSANNNTGTMMGGMSDPNWVSPGAISDNPAAVAPTLDIANSGDDIILTWTVSGANCSYEVHRSADPYFTPDATTMLGDPLPAGTDTYTDEDALLDMADYSYIVQANNCGETSSAPSNETGEFQFVLTPGDA